MYVLDKFQMNHIFKCKGYNDKCAQRKHGLIILKLFWSQEILSELWKDKVNCMEVKIILLCRSHCKS